jgi:large subunit ribosomal protein L24
MAAKGPLDGELAIDGRFAAGALDVSTKGTVRVSERTSPAAALEIKIANANLRSPRPVASGGTAELLPASVTLGLALTDGTLRLNDIKGTVAGAAVAGRLAIETQQQPIAFDGDLQLGTLDLTAAIATGVGLPAAGSIGASAGLWPAEPFQQIVLGASGQIVVKATRVALTPNLAARDFQGRLFINESQLALQVIDAGVAGGRVAGELIFLRESAGLLARARVDLLGAEAAELLPGDAGLSGRLALEIVAEGIGLNPIALIGALVGSGKITLTNGRLARLNPAAFDTVISAVNRGLPINAASVRDRMDSALASAALAIELAEAGISIEGGQARMLSNPVLGAPAVDLAVSGRVNLAEGAIDARLTLSVLPGVGAAINTRPEIDVAVRGPINAAKRTIDVTAFASWLALRAVEQQSKKLDVIEGGEPPSGAATADAPAPSHPASPAAQ